MAASDWDTEPDERCSTKEPDERFWVGVGRTRSNAYVIIAAGSAITSEVLFDA